MTHASEAKRGVIVNSRKDKRQTFRQMFAVPIVLGVLCMVGLAVALLADGIWDQAAMILIAGPLVAISWFPLRI